MSPWRPLPEKRSERDPQPVSASLDRVARGLGVPDTGVLAAVFSRWEEIVGPDVATHAVPVSLRDGVLVVSVDQPAWATQLRFLIADLKLRVAEATGGTVVVDVVVRVGQR